MDILTLSEGLDAKIGEIKRTLEKVKSGGHPVNEAQTEHYIIDPLLSVLGYELWEIIKQGHDAVGQKFPDYTLLPESTNRWFLEVKQLGHHLQDKDALQAFTYPFSQGAEWAVLTNGRTWYFYNAYLKKSLDEKRVIQIHDLFSDSDAIAKLSLLSRQSMESAGLTNAWVREQITAVVRRQLETPNSVIRKHLRKIASEEIGTSFDDVTLGKAIAYCGFAGPNPVVGTAMFSPQSAAKTHTDKIATPRPQSAAVAVPSPTLHTFKEIASTVSLATFRKPQRLEFADGHQEEVHSWADVAKIIVERVGAAYTLPQLPFKTGPKGNNYFLNSTALHGKGNKMLGHRIAQVGSDLIYVDTNRAVVQMAVSITAFLTAAGAPADVVKVRLV